MNDKAPRYTETEEGINVQAKYDCITGKRKLFVVGRLGQDISGGLYIKLGIQIPDKITITFVKEREKKDGR